MSRWACLSIFLLTIMIAANSARGEYVFVDVNSMPGDATHCCVAASPEGIVVAGWAENGRIYTQTYWEDEIHPLVDHGPGTTPTLCRADWGFVLAFDAVEFMKIREGDGYEWSSTGEMPGAGADLKNPRLSGPDEGCDFGEIYLTYEEQSYGLWFTSNAGVGWDLPELARQESHWDSFYPLALPRLYLGIWWPRVYHFNPMDAGLDYVDRISGWGAPQTIPAFLGSQMSGGASVDGAHKLLSLGPQPTCPCNTIWSLDMSPDGVWSEPVELTVDRDFYNWPQFPNLVVDGEGTGHGFWFQCSADYMMQPSGEELFYKTRAAGGEWVDQSALFAGESGHWCDISLGPGAHAAFIYSVGDYPERNPRLLYYRIPTASAEVPVFATQLTVHPNPSNPSTTISYSLALAGEVSISVHDPRGRRVARLVEGRREPGRHTLRWEGKGDDGGALSSGVYLIRLVHPGGKRSVRLALLK